MDPIEVPHKTVGNHTSEDKENLDNLSSRANLQTNNIEPSLSSKRKDSPTNSNSEISRPNKFSKYKEESVASSQPSDYVNQSNKTYTSNLSLNGTHSNSKHKSNEQENPDSTSTSKLINNVNVSGNKNGTNTVLEDADGFVIPTVFPKVNGNVTKFYSHIPGSSLLKGDSPNEGLIEESNFIPQKETLLDEDPVDRSYQAIPVAASLLPSQIQSLGNTSDMRWVVTGSDDGYIRKYDFFASINGKVPLTVAQRHATVDVCSRAGVISSYWDNQIQPQPGAQPIPINSSDFDNTFSTVHSLYLHSKALWCLSGLYNGDVNLYTVRHDEGKVHHSLRGHSAPVSVIKAFDQEKKAVTGSWDKTIKIWDLNTGKQINELIKHVNQISSISVMPNSSNVILSTSFDGNSFIWDLRQDPKSPVKSLLVPEKTPKWAISSCINRTGNMIFTGRRNSTIDGYDMRMNTISRTLIFPPSSGLVSSVLYHPLHDFLLAGSYDNLRMWNLNHPDDDSTLPQPSTHIAPYQLIPGHQTGIISQMSIDETGRYMTTTSGNRGWEGTSTNTAIFYEIKFEK